MGDPRDLNHDEVVISCAGCGRDITVSYWERRHPMSWGYEGTCPNPDCGVTNEAEHPVGEAEFSSALFTLYAVAAAFAFWGVLGRSPYLVIVGIASALVVYAIHHFPKGASREPRTR